MIVISFLKVVIAYENDIATRNSQKRNNKKMQLYISLQIELFMLTSTNVSPRIMRSIVENSVEDGKTKLKTKMMIRIKRFVKAIWKVYSTRELA